MHQAFFAYTFSESKGARCSEHLPLSYVRLFHSYAYISVHVRYNTIPQSENLGDETQRTTSAAPSTGDENIYFYMETLNPTSPNTTLKTKRRAEICLRDILMVKVMRTMMNLLSEVHPHRSEFEVNDCLAKWLMQWLLYETSSGARTLFRSST